MPHSLKALKLEEALIYFVSHRDDLVCRKHGEEVIVKSYKEAKAFFSQFDDNL